MKSIGLYIRKGSQVIKNKCLYSLLWLLCWACQSTTIYQETHTFPKKSWPATAIQRFTFQVSDTTQAYDICLLVKNTPDYPYQNLFIAYELQDGNAQLWQKELKDYGLFEKKTGKPLGTGWGKTKKHQSILLQGHHFAEPGEYTLNLTQFMRTEDLVGIAAIGIQVNKAP